MHENVDISKDLQQTKFLFDSLLLTQGGGAKGGASSGSDNTLYDIANDILTKVKLIKPPLHLAIFSHPGGEALEIPPLTSSRWIAMKFCIESMNPTDFDDLLNVPVAPPTS